MTPTVRSILRRGKQAAHRGLRTAHTLRSFPVLLRSPLFDQDWYRRQASRELRGSWATVRDYLTSGWPQDLSPHPLYEPQSHIPDRSRRLRGRVAPFVVFLRRPPGPRVRPHRLFDPETYRADHPQAAQHRLGAWGHFVSSAAPEDLLPLPKAIPRLPVPWGPFIENQRRHAARWTAQDELVREPRLTPQHDAEAENRLLAEIDELTEFSAGNPAVSVLTTVRNRPNQVLEAIASVLAQTFPDWELIIVDDGSDDDTPEAIAEVCRRDPRVTLLRREHSGVSASRNAAFAQARGRYVAWLDSDNTWTPRFLEVMLRGMSTRSLRAAFCGSEFVSSSGTLFREFAGGLEHLAIGNFIDLNVLVVERDLLDEVGGFDESLPRAVDYDLVYRIARQTDIGYLPLRGVVYADDTTDADRISVKERKTWNYVVRDRYTIDWEQMQRSLPRRAPDRVAVVITGRESWAESWRTVSSVLEHTGPDIDLEIVLVELGTPRADYLAVAALETVDPRIRVVRTAVNINKPGGNNVGLAATTAGTVVFLAQGVEVRSGWWEPLRTALRDPGTAVAGGLVANRRGLIASAGQVLPRDSVLPVSVLQDHPEADADPLPGRYDVPAVSGSFLAARAADLIAVHGFDPLFVDSFEDADLCLRLCRHTGGNAVLTPGSRADQPDWLPFGSGRLDPDNMSLFVSRWENQADDRPELWAAAGFALQDYHQRILRRPRYGRKESPDMPFTRPSLRPLREAPEPGERRWVIEFPDGAPDAPAVVGAAALADRLTALGCRVRTRPTALRDRTPTDLDDVVVVVTQDPEVTAPRGVDSAVVRHAMTSDGPQGFDLTLDAGQADDPESVATALLASFSR